MFELEAPDGGQLPASVRTACLTPALAPLFLLAPFSGYAAVLEEIVVNATKREVAAHTVPLSLEIHAGEEMYRDRLNNLEQLSSRVPNLIVGNSVPNTAVAIRGIGTGNDRALEQAVGLFVDGIYMPRSRQYRAPFLDVERVEVLRGPQAVLFGINSTAGAIDVVTARSHPGDATFGKLGAEYETEYGGAAVTAIAGGSAGKTLGLRGAIRYQDTGDGYYENRFTGVQENATEEVLARLSLVWEPVDRMSVQASYDYADFDTDGHIGELFGPGDAAVDGDGTLNWSRSMDGSLLAEFPGGEVARLDSEFHSARLGLDYQIGAFELSLLGGYADSAWNQFTDLDGGPITFFDGGVREDYDQTSLEIRLTSPADRTVEYHIGAYYGEANLRNEQPNLIDGTVVLAAQGFPIAGFENSRQWSNSSFDQDTKTASVFGALTWNAGNRLRLTAGARYNDEKKSYARDGECLALRDDGRFEAPDLANNPNDFLLFTFVNFCPTLNGVSGSREVDHLMPEFSIQWNGADNVMLYGRIANGFKSGGFAASTRVAPEFLEYDDEEAWNIEAGVKARLAADAVEVNAAIFRMDVDDLQVSSFDDVSGAAVLTNAANARTQGLELQGRWATSDWLNLGASLAWLDAEYRDFPRGPCAPSVSAADFCDLSGMKLPYAPEYSGIVFANLNYSINNRLAFRGRVAASYTDDYFTEGSLDPVGIQPAYTLVDTRISLGANDGSWEVALVGKNLTDEAILNASLPFLGSYIGYVRAPRTVAIQVTFVVGG